MSDAEAEFQVGDRVVYLGFKTPVAGKVFKVNIEIPKTSPEALEIRSYDIQLEGGGTLIAIQRLLRRAYDE